MVRDPAVPISYVGEADPEGRDRTAPERGDRVQDVTGAEGAHAPGGVGSEVPRSVRHDDHVGPEEFLRGEHAGPHGDGLHLSAERLPAGDPPVDQPSVAEFEHQS